MISIPFVINQNLHDEFDIFVYDLLDLFDLFGDALLRILCGRIISQRRCEPRKYVYLMNRR